MNDVTARKNVEALARWTLPGGLAPVFRKERATNRWLYAV
jgi:hypothetical protein